MLNHKINLCVHSDSEVVTTFFDELGYQEESVYYYPKLFVLGQKTKFVRHMRENLIL